MSTSTTKTTELAPLLEQVRTTIAGKIELLVSDIGDLSDGQAVERIETIALLRHMATVLTDYDVEPKRSFRRRVGCALLSALPLAVVALAIIGAIATIKWILAVWF